MGLLLQEDEEEDLDQIEDEVREEDRLGDKGLDQEIDQALLVELQEQKDKKENHMKELAGRLLREEEVNVQEETNHGLQEVLEIVSEDTK